MIKNKINNILINLNWDVILYLSIFYSCYVLYKKCQNNRVLNLRFLFLILLILVTLFLFIDVKYEINEILMNDNNDEYKKIKIWLGIVLSCLSLYLNVSKNGLISWKTFWCLCSLCFVISYASKVYHLELFGFIINCLNLNEVNFNIPVELAGFLYVCIHSLNIATLDMDSTKFLFSFVKDRLLEPIQCYKDGDEFSDNEVMGEDNEGRSTRPSSTNDVGVQGEATERQENNVVEEVVAEGNSAEDDSTEESDNDNNNKLRDKVHKNIKISTRLIKAMNRVPLDTRKIGEWIDNVNYENENKEENSENSNDPNEMKPITPEESKDPNWLSNLPKNDDDEEN